MANIPRPVPVTPSTGGSGAQTFAPASPSAAVPLLNTAQWGVFWGFAAALFGLSILDPKIAGIVGAGVIIVLVFKNAKGLGLE